MPAVSSARCCASAIARAWTLSNSCSCRARERGALAVEGVDALAQRAQPGDARVRRSRFGARRRVLLRRSAGVLVREGELAIVGAAGGRELFEREVLVVALEHPSARASEQVITARDLAVLFGRDVGAVVHGLVVVDQEPRAVARARERGVAPAGGEIARASRRRSRPRRWRPACRGRSARRRARRAQRRTGRAAPGSGGCRFRSRRDPRRGDGRCRACRCRRRAERRCAGRSPGHRPPTRGDRRRARRRATPWSRRSSRAAWLRARRVSLSRAIITACSTPTSPAASRPLGDRGLTRAGRRRRTCRSVPSVAAQSR